MQASEKTAFLSCSFNKKDAVVNDFIRSICDGLSIKCINVCEAYQQLPSEKAKQMIADSHMFIAVITRREKADNETFNMPASVHDEISMAYALSKPTLLIKEDGVNFEGFLNQYGTHISFSMNKLRTSSLLRAIVSSIHNLKIETIEPHELIPNNERTHLYADYFFMLVELVKENDQYIWKYSQSLKYIFTEKYDDVLHGGAWATLPYDGTSERISWDCKVISGSQHFKLDIKVISDTPNRLDYTYRISPAPIPGDYIELVSTYASKYFNAVFRTEANAKIQLGDKYFDCLDGTMPIHRNKHFKIQFRFPSTYQINKSDIFPCVASYSSGIDYLVESEMRRISCSVDDFAGNVIITLSAENPLLKHFYGIAWNIPER